MMELLHNNDNKLCILWVLGMMSKNISGPLVCPLFGGLHGRFRCIASVVLSIRLIGNPLLMCVLILASLSVCDFRVLPSVKEIVLHVFLS